jgi:hypothetical protein
MYRKNLNWLPASDYERLPEQSVDLFSNFSYADL